MTESTVVNCDICDVEISRHISKIDRTSVTFQQHWTASTGGNQWRGWDMCKKCNTSFKKWMDNRKKTLRTKK
jgi:hypothetical protein